MAADLGAYFRTHVTEPFVYLCAEDKAVVGAALLASMAGGPALIVPYSLNAPVLVELQQWTGYTHAIVDGTRPVPPGVHCIEPKPAGHAWSAGRAAPKQPQTEWVRLFTGGSTGAPKMWTKTVRNLLAETNAIISHYQIDVQDRLLATVSPNHIYGLLYSVLVPMLASASVAASTPSFPGEIESAARLHDATLLISVPAHYRALNGHSFAKSSLRLAFSSAGMLAAEDAAAFSAQTGVGIAEIYGSTETGGIAARVRAAGEVDFKPYANISVKIVGERLNVRSDYLSPGLAMQADGYFCIGDRVAATPGGRFELLGRSDGIVKVGGRRVDLEMVRQALKKLPAVREAVAVSLPVNNGRQNQIVAVVEGPMGSDAVDRMLLESLEPYARPRSIRVVDKIPLTAAGKFDRKTIVGLFS
jgi:acyl-coenzyme A synthetase/AMP-(fatty) acid ligase